jgi:hypothetical protein
VVDSLTRLARLASLVICVIVFVSFLIFVANQTKTASAHQQEVVNGTVVAGAPSPAKPAPPPSAIHKAIDEAANTFTSPFSGLTAGSSSQWVIHGGDFVLTLLVYGFGIGFLARVIRVRV